MLCLKRFLKNEFYIGILDLEGAFRLTRPSETDQKASFESTFGNRVLPKNLWSDRKDRLRSYDYCQAFWISEVYFWKNWGKKNMKRSSTGLREDGQAVARILDLFCLTIIQPREFLKNSDFAFMLLPAERSIPMIAQRTVATRVAGA